ncbi:RXLR effector domain-containing protein [Phytophthora infestans]|uniref:RxLR effector protein n=1 Tax=Phytophthora infestans TaxID=4787 RepID=A0A8S9TJ58_PHYIN|nr:RXLR effector domain-containing protein [Phytophthora infestans]
MRVSPILLVGVALTLLTAGSALSTVVSSESASLLQSVDAVRQVDVVEKRSLRMETIDDDNTEERGASWTDLLKSYMPGTLANETSKIKKLASTFAGYRAQDLHPHTVYKIAKKQLKYPFKKAVKYGYRYEKYLESPSLYTS